MTPFRNAGVYWAVGSVADSWYGVPVRVPVGLIRAAGLARGGSYILQDPSGQIETVGGSDLSHCKNYYLFCMVRNVDGVRCGFSSFTDSIGSRSVEAALRVRILLGTYLSELLGSAAEQLSSQSYEVLFHCLLLISAVRGLKPVSCRMVVDGGVATLYTTVRLDGVLEDIEVTVGGSGA